MKKNYTVINHTKHMVIQFTNRKEALNFARRENKLHNYEMSVESWVEPEEDGHYVYHSQAPKYKVVLENKFTGDTQEVYFNNKDEWKRAYVNSQMLNEDLIVKKSILQQQGGITAFKDYKQVRIFLKL